MKTLLVGQSVVCPGCFHVLSPQDLKRGETTVNLRCDSPHGGYNCKYRGRLFKTKIPTIDVELLPA